MTHWKLYVDWFLYFKNVKVLTVLVAGLPERFPLREHNGNDEILEAGDVEEAGVLKVHDVVLVHLCVIVVGFVEVQRPVAHTWGGISKQLGTKKTSADFKTFLVIFQLWRRVAFAYSVRGVHTEYHGCCWTQRNAKIWKPKQMRIWVSTENSRGPEIRPDGGRRETSSFHAGFRLTEERRAQKETTIVKENTQKGARGSKVVKTRPSLFSHTYWWRLWGEWLRCRWRGTGSRRGYWGSEQQNQANFFRNNFSILIFFLFTVK